MYLKKRIELENINVIKKLYLFILIRKRFLKQKLCRGPETT